MEIVKQERDISWAHKPNVLSEIIDDDLPPTELVTAVFGYTIDGNSVLLTKNSRGWDVPGGHIEPGESPEQALAREINEETGAKIEIVKSLGYRKIEILAPKPEDFNLPYPTSYMVFYLTKLTRLGEFNPNFECEDRLFVPLEEVGEYIKDTTHLQEAVRVHRILQENS